ncbi:MAG: Condensin subunit ScpB, partial [Pseudonocardiales bacterium]|nr:Condensin subunit ScpB [Pseudonocardiales bacterium]
PGASPDDTTAAAPDDGSELAPDEASELAPDEASELAPDEASEPAPVAPLTDPVDLSAAIEAILFVVEAPVSVSSIAAALQQPVDTVQAAIEALRAGYDERQAGIELRHVAGGVRLYTRPSVAAQVEVFLQDGQRSRLTQAALETLAVIAYRQPVTRSRVSAIRGVNVDGVVRTLTSRGLIVEVGSDPETGGGLYRTTDLFLERMGLQTLTELPSLAPLLPELDGLDTDEL